jgi:hypothetical protein
VQLTTPGMVLGSPHFISPERAMGSDFGPPSDLFSLGVTLYTAVEGRPPFDKGDPIETMHAVVEDPPTPAARAGSLDTVLMGLLEKDPVQRFDVPTARTMLRQQLAGPLASKAPSHMMTDPYSVVPAQRPPAAETQQIPPQPPKPTGQIGGRAMLAPGESLTNHLARLDEGPGGHRRAEEQSGPMTEAMPGQTGGADPTSVVPTSGAGGDTTAVVPAREAWNGARAARDPMPGTAVHSTVTKRGAMVGTTVHAVKQGTGRAVTTVQGWSRNKRLAAVGGALAVVLLLVLVFALAGNDDPAPLAAQNTGGGGTQQSSEQTQEYKDRGITVEVPKGWKRTAAGSWVDYSDPKDSKRKVRILVERSGGTPASFLGVAENTLRNRSTNCPKPYAQVGLTPAKISGQDGAVLEYTCGTGPSARHGLWGAVVTGGKAYSFYLTTKESQFAESKPIFDEMIGTYALS